MPRSRLTDGVRTADFWSRSQPGFRFSSDEPGTPKFFAEVERHRYALEPHIPEVAQFERWADRDVLEVGCGIGTDGARFADQARGTPASTKPRPPSASPGAGSISRNWPEDSTVAQRRACPLTMARSTSSTRTVSSITSLTPSPLSESSTAFCGRAARHWSWSITEIRSTTEYDIMLIRRMLAAMLVVPVSPLGDCAADRRIARRPRGPPGAVAHARAEVSDRRRTLSLQQHRRARNPLSKVYSRSDVRALFSDFASVTTTTRYLNLRVIPGGGRLLSSRSPDGWSVGSAGTSMYRRGRVHP